MKLPAPSARLVLAGTLAGLIFVSPALSSREPVSDSLPTGSAVSGKTRTVRPAPRVARAEAPCPTVRRSLWLEGEGWVVRRVPACR